MKTKDKMERYRRRRYEADKWKCNARLDFEQRNIERLTSGSAGPKWTVKKKKKVHTQAGLLLKRKRSTHVFWFDFSIDDNFDFFSSHKYLDMFAAIRMVTKRPREHL